MRECNKCGGMMEEAHIQALVRSKVHPYVGAFTSPKTVVLWVCMGCEKVKGAIQDVNPTET